MERATPALLLIPVELPVRELDPRHLLACIAAREAWVFHLDRLTPGDRLTYCFFSENSVSLQKLYDS
jgi:hypothetical protein